MSIDTLKSSKPLKRSLLLLLFVVVALLALQPVNARSSLNQNVQKGRVVKVDTRECPKDKPLIDDMNNLTELNHEITIETEKNSNNSDNKGNAENVEASTSQNSTNSEVVNPDTNESKKELLCTYFTIKLSNNEEIIIPYNLGYDTYIRSLNIKNGTKVLVSIYGDNKLVIGIDRISEIVISVLVFIALTVAVAGWQGIKALVGLVITYLGITLFFIPQIAAGKEPILISFITSSVLITISMLISHGFNKKTISAITGTLVTFIFAAITSKVAIDKLNFSGMTSEEFLFLIPNLRVALNLKHILIATIMFGTVGSIDDVTVSQAAFVETLTEGNSNINMYETYQKAMKLGKDHIASMINTLLITYTAGSLPLLLLMYATGSDIVEILNTEILAEDIIRSLIGSVSLIAAVPITTVIAVMLTGKKRWKHF